jgi:hypothetical protein
MLCFCAARSPRRSKSRNHSSRNVKSTFPSSPRRQSHSAPSVIPPTRLRVLPLHTWQVALMPGDRNRSGRRARQHRTTQLLVWEQPVNGTFQDTAQIPKSTAHVRPSGYLGTDRVQGGEPRRIGDPSAGNGEHLRCARGMPSPAELLADLPGFKFQTGPEGIEQSAFPHAGIAAEAQNCLESAGGYCPCPR